MSIILNGTTLSDLTFNGVALDKVIYNGVTVFEKVSVIREPTSGEYLSVGVFGQVKSWYNDTSVSPNKTVFCWQPDFVMNYTPIFGQTSCEFNGWIYYKGISSTIFSGFTYYGIYRIKK